ncbi:hypothetical protein ES706_02406 [subsurface metagenome]
MKGKEIWLGEVTNEIVEKWSERFDKREDGYYCKKCGSQIMQTTCYVSVYFEEFRGRDAGSGEVRHVNYPYCPKCDGELEMARACVYERRGAMLGGLR